MIKLAAQDAIADRPVVDLMNGLMTDDAGVEGQDRLQYPPPGIGIQIQRQLIDDLRCDPARAGLVAREASLVDQMDVQPAVPQFPGQRGTSRSTANDEHIALLHAQAPGRSSL